MSMLDDLKRACPNPDEFDGGNGCLTQRLGYAMGARSESHVGGPFDINSLILDEVFTRAYTPEERKAAGRLFDLTAGMGRGAEAYKEAVALAERLFSGAAQSSSGSALPEPAAV